MNAGSKTTAWPPEKEKPLTDQNAPKRAARAIANHGYRRLGLVVCPLCGAPVDRLYGAGRGYCGFCR